MMDKIMAYAKKVNLEFRQPKLGPDRASLGAVLLLTDAMRSPTSKEAKR